MSNQTGSRSRRAAFVVAAILFVFLPQVQAAADVESADSPKATLIVFRPKFSPPQLFRPTLLVNGRVVGELSPRTHVEIEVAPGTHQVFADWGGGHGVPDRQTEVKIQAGETAYVRITNRVSVPLTGFTHSSLDETEPPDLSKSRLIVVRSEQWIEENQESLVDLIRRGSFADQSRSARKIVAENLFTAEVLQALEDTLLAIYQEPIPDRHSLDAAAWMTRALSTSRREEFLPTLELIREDAANKKLRKYAKKFIRRHF